MASRRQFFQCGLTFSTLSLTGLAPLSMAVAAPEGPALKLESFVADQRFTESMAASRTLKAQGVPIAEISGDMTSLWSDQYSRQWKQQPMSLAGVTGKDALFVLETLAPDYGMRVIHKAPLVEAKSLPGHADITLMSWIIVPRKIAQELG